MAPPNPEKVAAQQSLPKPQAPFVPRKLPRIDVHTHLLLGTSLRAARLFQKYGISLAVNLSGAPGGHGFEEFPSTTKSHMATSSPLPRSISRKPQAPAMASGWPILSSKRRKPGHAGSRSPKVWGLATKDRTASCSKSTIQGSMRCLKSRSAEAAVAIHVADPQAFWQEPGPKTND